MRALHRPPAAPTTLAAALLTIVIAAMPEQAGAQMRIEVRPLETVTLTTQQFLTGEKNGKPVMLAGELRIPTPGTDRLAAVVLIHGSGGAGALHERWLQEITGIGGATFLVDSFSGRGIVSTSTDQSQLDSVAMMIDAYRALGALAQHPRIDPNRIVVMGFSKGAVAAVYSSGERFRNLYGPANVEFAAHVGLYTPCNVSYREETKVSGKPIRLFHGIADDWVSIEPCRGYVARLKAAGADAVLTEYPGAYHAYDRSFSKEPAKYPQAQTTRHCLLAEGEGGEIVNTKTGTRYDLNTDACVERGTTVAYNEAATVGTTKAVKELLSTLTSGPLSKN
jgi:dienelactone hydrolase